MRQGVTGTNSYTLSFMIINNHKSLWNIVRNIHITGEVCKGLTLTSTVHTGGSVAGVVSGWPAEHCAAAVTCVVLFSLPL